jgi:hypothetical protein
LFAEAPTVDVKEDLVAAVGLHGSSAAVVPILARWMTSAEPPSVRAQAAKWLGHHGAGELSGARRRGGTAKPLGRHSKLI